MLRLRTIAYPLLLMAVAVGFIAVLMTKFAFDAKLMRGRGNPFQQTAPGIITNNFNLRLTNRTEEPRTYTVTVLEPEQAKIIGTSIDSIELKGNGTSMTPIVVEVPATALGAQGQKGGKLQITDDIGNERFVTMRVLGPRT